MNDENTKTEVPQQVTTKTVPLADPEALYLLKPEEVQLLSDYRNWKNSPDFKTGVFHHNSKEV